jgi:hypothetical protein
LNTALKGAVILLSPIFQNAEDEDNKTVLSFVLYCFKYGIFDGREHKLKVNILL